MGAEPNHERRSRVCWAELNALSFRLLGHCITVHRELGPGLLESAYEEALAYELSTAGERFHRQLEVPVVYRGVPLSCGYRLDFLVAERIVLELKAVTELLPVHTAQLLTYMKLQRLHLGLLINFNVGVLHDGVRRLVLESPNPAASSRLCG